MGKKREDARRRNKKVINNPPRWMICCEGESEVEYLKSLVNDLAQGRPHGIIFGCNACKCETHGACRRQSQDLINQVELCGKQTFEKIWAVFDEDGEASSGADEDKRKKFAQAVKDWYREFGKTSYLQIAWSKPCFEYWMALHDGSYMDSATPDQINHIVKAHLRNYYGITDKEARRLKASRKKLIEKPYPGSYIALGGRDGSEQAARSAQRHYANDQLENLCQKGDFKDLSCGTNMHTLVKAIYEYFGIAFQEAP